MNGHNSSHHHRRRHPPAPGPTPTRPDSRGHCPLLRHRQRCDSMHLAGSIAPLCPGPRSLALGTSAIGGGASRPRPIVAVDPRHSYRQSGCHLGRKASRHGVSSGAGSREPVLSPERAATPGGEGSRSARILESVLPALAGTLTQTHWSESVATDRGMGARNSYTGASIRKRRYAGGLLSDDNALAKKRRSGMGLRAWNGAARASRRHGSRSPPTVAIADAEGCGATVPCCASVSPSRSARAVSRDDASLPVLHGGGVRRPIGQHSAARLLTHVTEAL